MGSNFTRQCKRAAARKGGTTRPRRGKRHAAPWQRGPVVAEPVARPALDFAALVAAFNQRKIA